MRNFLADESGVTAIEYALLAVLIALTIGTGAAVVGVGIDFIFNGVGGEVQNASIPPVP